jgi:hypothetical protein
METAKGEMPVAQVRHIDDTRAERTTAQKRRRQAVQYARAKATERREQEPGVSGLVSERAGEWSLDGPDWDFMERQKYLWNPLMDYWFRMDIEAWDNIPEAPVLLVGIHSGAPFVWDAWTVGIQWWRHFGRRRQFHGTAHDALMATPGVGAYFRRMGVIPARSDSMASALAAGHDVASGPAASATRCATGPSATRRPSPVAADSSAWPSGAACRSCRSRPSADPTRCPSWPRAAVWPTGSSSIRSHA